MSDARQKTYDFTALIVDKCVDLTSGIVFSCGCVLFCFAVFVRCQCEYAAVEKESKSVVDGILASEKMLSTPSRDAFSEILFQQ